MAGDYDITLSGIRCPKCKSTKIEGEIFSPIVESWIECKECDYGQYDFMAIGEIKDWLDFSTDIKITTNIKGEEDGDNEINGSK